MTREHPKLEGARAYAKGFSLSDRVLFLYDGTIFRSGKDGLLVTARGIHWCNKFATPGSLSWPEFESAIARKSTIVLTPGAHAVNVDLGGEAAASAIAAALTAIAPIARLVIEWERGAEQRLAERTKHAEEARVRKLIHEGYRIQHVRFRCGVCGGTGLCGECGRTGRCTRCGGGGVEPHSSGYDCYGCRGNGMCSNCGGRATCGGCGGAGILEGPRWVR